MKKFKRYVMCMTASLMLVMGMAMTSSGAKDDVDDINGATLTVTSKITADSDLGELDVTAVSSSYEVDSFTFVDAGSSWKPGEIPKVQVILAASEGYRFSTKVTSNKITVKGGTCTNVKRLDSGSSLEVTLRLKAVSGTMGTIGDAFWVSSPIGKAKWDQADNASAYQVKLYHKDSAIKTVDKTTTNTYNFYPYMTKTGTYYFKVRPVPRSTNESAYLDSGEWQTSDELEIGRADVAPAGLDQSNSSDTGGPVNRSDGSNPASGWVQDHTGWWYHEKDGSYPVNRWSHIDNQWYLFDMAGYMKTGWQLWEQKYYYLTVNGKMVTGWFQDNKRWYYMGTDGAMQTGWIQPDGAWYYIYSDGSRASGWISLNRKWYYFNPDNGAMAVNTTIGGYYVNGDGVWVN